jgi:hypothetical protein
VGPVVVKTAKNLTVTGRVGKPEKIAYLGAVTTSAPAAMREQLKLAPGVGLVVDQVEPGTPAEQAGIKQHDVLEKMDDQLLVNPDQLLTLQRSHKPGDEVTLSIVRQGQRQSVKAKLVEREIDAGALRIITADGDPGPNFLRLDLPGNVATVQGNVLGGRLGGAGGGGGGDVLIGGRNVAMKTFGDGQQTTVWADDAVSISIERRGGKTTQVVVKDRKTDQTLYSGDADGVAKLFDARPELRDKMKKAQDAAGREPARMQFTPQPNPFGKGGAAMGIGGGGGAGRVVRWQDNDHILLMRMAGRSPTYLLALSKKDGRTVFEGPVAREEDRRSVPAEVAEEFQMILTQPEVADELGGPDKTTTPPTPATPADAPRIK